MNGFKGTASFHMSDFENVLDPKNKGRKSGGGVDYVFIDGKLVPEKRGR